MGPMTRFGGTLASLEVVAFAITLSACRKSQSQRRDRELLEREVRNSFRNGQRLD